MSSDAFSEALTRLQGIHEAKNHDYTGGRDRLANYAFSAEMIGVPTHVGMFGRMCEKVYRLRSLFAKGGAARNESVKDTLDDIAIIAILMRLALNDPEYQGGPRAE